MEGIITNQIHPQWMPKQLPRTRLPRRFLGSALLHGGQARHSRLQLAPQSLNDPESLQEAPESSGAKDSIPQLAQSHNYSEPFLGKKFPNNRLNILNRGNGLASSEAATLSFGAFLRSLRSSVAELSPGYLWSLLLFNSTVLYHEAENLTLVFNSKLGNPSGSLVLSFGEAIAKLLPGMAHSALFIVCYPLILLLASEIHPVLQIIFMMVLFFVPLFYFPELVDKLASTGIEVACGSLKLPLIWFTSSGTLALSFICILLILSGMYVIWRYILKGKPSLKEPGGSVNDLSQILVQH
ncbi:hypothetical protein VNO77_21133 [Canavalia gladiata]|uniref:Uncharacterized protein n=1 Tax=Canavalia gladiata TaxID=3824 RepID=A0AAN9QN42_CANGL